MRSAKRPGSGFVAADGREVVSVPLSIETRQMPLEITPSGLDT
jgi:hypothetical protein